MPHVLKHRRRTEDWEEEEEEEEEEEWRRREREPLQPAKYRGMLQVQTLNPHTKP